MASQTSNSTRSQTASRTSPRKRRAASEDALALLRADHDAVLELFDKYQASRRKEQKQKLAEQICLELTVHATIEEEIFYPELRQAEPIESIDDILNEADVEHDGAKKLIAEIEASNVDDEKFDARIKVLSEYIKHHVKEEYRCIFPAARKAGLDLDEMAARLRTRKEQLKSEQQIWH
jgi:hemerythrin superfamily protein